MPDLPLVHVLHAIWYLVQKVHFKVDSAYGRHSDLVYCAILNLSC